MPDQRDLVHGGEAERWGGWSWREPFRGEHFRRCSYCGSIHPADLAAEPVWRASWADRKYGWPHKFYVDIPNRQPDALFCVGSTNGDNPGTTYDGRSDWIPVADLTDEQRAIVERDGMGGSDRTTFYLFGTRPHHFGKFYTIHLADPALDEHDRAVIEGRSGLHFEFVDGAVRWSAVPR
jgi:hypothetical protein